MIITVSTPDSGLVITERKNVDAMYVNADNAYSSRII